MSRRSVATGACCASTSSIDFSIRWYRTSISSSNAIDLVAELDVLCLERVDRTPHRAEHDGALLLQVRLERMELCLELDAGHQPNRPVT